MILIVFVCLLVCLQAITAGMLSAISDVISQKLSGIQKLQIRRLLLKVVSLLCCF